MFSFILLSSVGTFTTLVFEGESLNKEGIWFFDKS